MNSAEDILNSLIEPSDLPQEGLQEISSLITADSGISKANFDRFVQHIERFSETGQMIIDAYKENPELKLSPYILKKEFKNPNHLILRPLKNQSAIGWESYCELMQKLVIDKLEATHTDNKLNLKDVFTLNHKVERSHRQIIDEIESKVRDALKANPSKVKVSFSHRDAIYHAVSNYYRHPISKQIDWKYIAEVLVNRNPEWSDRVYAKNRPNKHHNIVPEPNFQDPTVKKAWSIFTANLEKFRSVGDKVVEAIKNDPHVKLSPYKLKSMDNPEYLITRHSRNQEGIRWDLFLYFMQTEIFNKMPVSDEHYKVNIYEHFVYHKKTSRSEEQILNELEEQILASLKSHDLSSGALKLPLESKGALYHAVCAYFREPITQAVDWEKAVQLLIEKNPSLEGAISARNNQRLSWGSKQAHDKLLDYYAEKLSDLLIEHKPTKFNPSWIDKINSSLGYYIRTYHDADWQTALIDKLPGEFQKIWSYAGGSIAETPQIKNDDAVTPVIESDSHASLLETPLNTVKARLSESNHAVKSMLKDIPDVLLPKLYERTLILHQHLNKFFENRTIPWNVLTTVNNALTTISQQPVYISNITSELQKGKIIEAQAMGKALEMQYGKDNYFGEFIDQLSQLLTPKHQARRATAISNREKAKYEFAAMLLQNAIYLRQDHATHPYTPLKPGPEAIPAHMRSSDNQYTGYCHSLRQYVSDILNDEDVKPYISPHSECDFSQVEYITTVSVPSIDFRGVDAVIRLDSGDGIAHYTTLDFTVNSISNKQGYKADIVAKMPESKFWDKHCLRSAAVIACDLISKAIRNTDTELDDKIFLSQIVADHFRTTSGYISPGFERALYERLLYGKKDTPGH